MTEKIPEMAAKVVMTRSFIAESLVVGVVCPVSESEWGFFSDLDTKIVKNSKVQRLNLQIRRKILTSIALSIL